MRMRSPLSLLLALLTLLPPILVAQTPASEIRNVILIGWDGAQRNHVNECLSRNELPVLKKLIETGSYVDIDVRGTTDTKAGWTQILTGYNPEVTGVYSNSRYQPIPKGYTIGERLKQFFGPEFVSVAVIGKKGHVDSDGPERAIVDARTPAQVKALRRAQKGVVNRNILRQLNLPNRFVGGKIVQEGNAFYVEMPGKPYYHTKDGMDVFINGLSENSRVAEKAMELIEKFKDKRFFFFVHFAEVDHNGHRFGENSAEYTTALISCDSWTGKIMHKLEELKLAGNTLIYITADHGFDEGMTRHSNAPYVFLATNDKAVRKNGLRVDITPTILAREGIDLSTINPPLNGKPLLAQ